MHPLSRLPLPALALAAALLAPLPASAQAFGTKAKGLAGAGVALPQDAMAARLNPAGMVFAGKRVDFSLASFSPIRSYTVTGVASGAPGTVPLAPETVQSQNSNYIIPMLGANWMLGTQSSLGITMYGTGGLNTSYPGSAAGGLGTFGAGPAGVDIQQIFILPTYARKVNDKLAVGISPVFLMQRFTATGLLRMAPYAADGTGDNLSNRGRDTSFGAGLKVGVLGDVSSRLTLGASYQTRVWTNKFEKYSDLFAEQGSYDAPPTLLAGLAYKLTPAHTIAFDVEQVWNSDIPSISNPFSNFLQGVALNNPGMLLGGSNGVGFGWRDTTTFRLGWQWQSSPRWTWRAGMSYGRIQVPSSEVLMNILAPSIQDWRFTTGFTRSLGKSDELSLSLMYAPPASVTGPNPLEVPGAENITLRSHQFEIETNWAKRF